MSSGAQYLFEYLRDVLYDPDNARMDLDRLPEDMKELGQGIQYFSICVLESMEFARNLSKGNLDIGTPPPSNEVAAPLKALHARLKHLAWQAQQVSQGDYRQQVEFMGEFSKSFNTMTKQLESRRRVLLEEIEKGNRKTIALKRANRLLEAISAKMSQWIVVMDGETYEWTFSNHQAEDVLKDLNYKEELCRWMQEQARSLCDEHGEPCPTELALHGEGGSQYFAVEIHPLIGYEDKSIAFLLADISTEKAYLDKLYTTAYTDKLTKLYNRHYGMTILDEWINNGDPFILGFVDIDNLKSVNDKYGHCKGDEYILAVTDMLRSFSKEVILCRLGGDEFIFLVQEWDLESARVQMEKIRNDLIHQGEIDPTTYKRSISYGLIEVGKGNYLSAEDLLNIADERMYEYKRAYKMKQRKRV